MIFPLPFNSPSPISPSFKWQGMIAGSTARIRLDTLSNPLPINRGVKQGDPLSWTPGCEAHSTLCRYGGSNYYRFFWLSLCYRRGRRRVHPSPQSRRGFYTRTVDNSITLREGTTKMISGRVLRSVRGRNSKHSISIDLTPLAWELLFPRHSHHPIGWKRHWTPSGRDVIVVHNSFPRIAWLFGEMWY